MGVERGEGICVTSSPAALAGMALGSAFVVGAGAEHTAGGWGGPPCRPALEAAVPEGGTKSSAPAKHAAQTPQSRSAPGQ